MAILRKFDYDKLVGYSAISISLIALVVSVVQVQVMLRQERAAVWPRIQLGMSNSNNPQFDEKGKVTSIRKTASFTMYNSGVGPALIQGVFVRYRNKPILRWRALFSAVGNDTLLQPNSQARVRDISLIAGEERVFFATEEGTVADTLAKTSREIEIACCYCSVYNDCWLVSRTMDAASAITYTPCDSCPKAAAEQLLPD